MELGSRIREFLVSRRRKLRAELESRYGVPPEEMDGLVDRVIDQTYRKALALAEEISCMKRPVLLFIWQSACPICRDSHPEFAQFSENHPEILPISLDYSKAEGLIYHILNQEDDGMLPLISLISNGELKMMSIGRRVTLEMYESIYSSLINSAALPADPIGANATGFCDDATCTVFARGDVQRDISGLEISSPGGRVENDSDSPQLQNIL